jgi:hypothetical protein
MTHYLATVGTSALVAILAAVIGWFGRTIVRRLDDIVGLPEAVAKLADAIQGWDAFRADVDRRLTEHDRQLSRQGQRITNLETKGRP